MSDGRAPAIRFKLIALLFASAAMYLIGNAGVALWDRDEPRYAQTSKHMVESGDWIVPRFLDVVRTAKPIFIYWCQGAAMKLFGKTPFAARLPSAVAMVLTLALVGIVVWRRVDPERALWTTFVFATSALTIAAAKMCLTDSVLLLFITIGQLCVYEIWRGNRSWTLGIIWGAAIGVAGLTKGPVALGVHGMTGLVLLAFSYAEHKSLVPAWRSIASWFTRPRPLIAIVVIIAIVVPWIVAVERHEPGFIMRSVRHDLIERAQGSLEGHKGPPGYYLVTVWGTFFPWSVLLPATIVLGWKRWRIDPNVRFALAAVIGPWVMFEIVQTKLPHYLLPCFPQLAFLTADMLIRSIRGEYNDLRTSGAKLVFAIWGIIVVALALSPWLAARSFRPLPWEAMAIFTLAGCIYALAVFVRFQFNDIARGAATMGIGMMLVVAIAFAVYLPRAEFLRLSPRVARELTSRDASKVGDVVMIDYKEPSLAFYQGGTIREKMDGYLSSIPFEKWPTWIVTTRDSWRTTPDDIKRQLNVVGSFHGLAYADSGRVVEVMIVKKTDGGAAAR